MYAVFDLDGVLVDTRDAVVKAYREVGVEMPTDAWGLPWYEWLDDPALHTRKTGVYVEMIREGELDEHLLPGLDAFRQLHSNGATSFLLTGASPETVWAFRERYLNRTFGILGASCTAIQKALALRNATENTVYVDDDEVIGRRIVDWSQSEHVHFIHYERFTALTREREAHDLYAEVMKSWMPLS